MTGGTGGRLTSPAYRLKSQAVKPASTCDCKLFACSFISPPTVSGCSLHEQNQLRPSAGKVEPFRVLCVVGRNRCLQTIDELAQATGPVLDWGGSKADAYPGLGQGIRMVVWYGVQQPLDEQVVDVDSDVMVVEGQIDRSFNGQTIGLLVFTNTRMPLWQPRGRGRSASAPEGMRRMLLRPSPVSQAASRRNELL